MPRGRPKKIVSIDSPMIIPEIKIDPNQTIISEVKPYLESKQESSFPEPTVYNCHPQIVRKRNEYGLLTTVNYVFKEDGKVDWRKMIKPEFLVFNRDKKDEIEKTYGKKLEDLKVTEVEDKYLLILLFGIRYLASLRGFYSVVPTVNFVSDYKAVVTTNIAWIPNNDNEMRTESFGDTASTSPLNTNGFGQQFLESIAVNRSFVRAVRNYLEINIVGKDEVAPSEKEDRKPSVSSSVTTINSVLQKTAEEAGLTFNQFKDAVKLRYKDKTETDVEKWASFDDLNPSEAYKLTNILKAKLLESKKE